MRRAAVASAVATAALVLASPAGALFEQRGAQVGGNSFAAATLAPSGPVTVAWTCQGRDATGAVTWTPSPSTFATGYRVLVDGVPVGETAATSVTVAARRGDRLTVEVVALAHSWTSPPQAASTRACV